MIVERERETQREKETERRGEERRGGGHRTDENCLTLYRDQKKERKKDLDDLSSERRYKIVQSF